MKLDMTHALKLTLILFVLLANIQCTQLGIQRSPALDLSLSNLSKEKYAPETKPAEMSVLVTVTDEHRLDVATEICARIYEAMNTQMLVNITCKETPAELIKLQENQLRSHFNYHIAVARVSPNEMNVAVDNWLPEDTLEFSTVKFHYENKDANKVLNSLQLLTKNLAAYEIGKNYFKVHLALEQIQSDKNFILAKDGTVLDSLTKEPATQENIYESFVNSQSVTKDELQRIKKNRSYIRAGVEIAAILGFGTYEYYTNVVSNKLDFDYPNFWKSMKAKFVTGDAIRFDDNIFRTNLGHTFAGMVYYQVGRNNGMTGLEATLFNLAASSFWEGVIEFREVFSIGDTFLTGIGGSIVGEALYQLSRGVLAKSNTTIAKLFSSVLNGPGLINFWLDGHPNRPVHTSDFNNSIWSQFDFGAAIGAISRDGSKANYFGASLNGVVVNFPNYNKPGKEAYFTNDTSVAKILVDVKANGFGIEDFRFLTQVLYATYYNKNIKEDDRGQLRGHIIHIGAASGFNWEQKGDSKKSQMKPTHNTDAITDADPNPSSSANRNQPDFLASVQIIGANATLVGFYKGWHVELSLDFFGEFGLVHSLALDELDRVKGTRQGLQSVIQNGGYYYGYGRSNAVQLILKNSRWSFGGEYRYATYDSINHRLRFQDETTLNYKYTDSESASRVWIGYNLKKNIRIEIYIERKLRVGHIDDLFFKKAADLKKGAQLIYSW